MITPETIQKIKDAAHIEEVVSRFLSLRRRGTNYVACCPFHQEKTGSFNVNPARNIYKCFGCGKSGDSISFLMEHDHKTYPEALRFLADMYGIEVEEEELSDEVRARQMERDSLLKLTAFAQQHFSEALPSDHPYLRGRAISPETASGFGLGLKQGPFAPLALSQGYSSHVLTTAALADENLADTLPDGIVFPIYMRDGKPVSFVVKSDRWTFAPPSPIFSYGRALFGFKQAQKAIGQRDKCYLLTHFEQVLAMHQAGIANTIAPCSASITADQIKAVRRFSNNITLVCSAQAAMRFDPQVIMASGVNLRLVVFPQGMSPDSLAMQQGATALQTYLDDHEENFVLYRVRHMTRQPEAVRNLLLLISNPIERAAYVPLVADILGIDEEQLLAQLQS